MINSTRVFLRKQIKENIDSVLQSFFMHAHPDSQTPYAIADLRETDDEVGLTYSLEIEMIDENDDTTSIEAKCDEIKELLDRKRSIVQNYAYIIFFNNCTTKINDEKFIKTRSLNFTIRLYQFE